MYGDIMRITGRQLRQIIKEELGKGIDWKAVEDAMWSDAVPALQSIWGKRIPRVDEETPTEQLEGLSIAVGTILGPSVKIWGDLGKVGNFILFSDQSGDSFSTTSDLINEQLMAVRAGLNLPLTGGWDAALQEQCTDLMMKLIAGGGIRGSALAARSTKTYPAGGTGSAQAQTK
jgi:hypothetical protein